MDITYSNATQVHEVIAQKHWEQTHKARHTGHSTLGTNTNLQRPCASHQLGVQQPANVRIPK